MSRPVHDEQAYLDALTEVGRTPQHGAPDSLRVESVALGDGPRGLRRVHLLWSFEPYADDPRPRTAAGRIEGESSRDLDPHPMNDFYDPEPLAGALWDQAGLTAADVMRAAYDVEPGPVTDEHRSRALALIPSRDDWWHMLLDELGQMGRVLAHDETHIEFEDYEHQTFRFSFGPQEWFAHRLDSVVADLASGFNFERRGGGVSPQQTWDALSETLATTPATALRLGERGLEPDPAYPARPSPDFDAAGGRWEAYRPLVD